MDAGLRPFAVEPRLQAGAGPRIELAVVIRRQRARVARVERDRLVRRRAGFFGHGGAQGEPRGGLAFCGLRGRNMQREGDFGVWQPRRFAQRQNPPILFSKAR
ncbi:MAG: hypothetical protein BWZ10_00332 [candidate division BRC1 bacterium ADurb.BinA364]|nr:MAG: hypothetical protein BWZ10_00332 [candidate division BRC1 bacterium ADurb.BinA364]